MYLKSSSWSSWLLCLMTCFVGLIASMEINQMSMIEFDDNSIQETLEQSEYSLIYFYSDSCKYCRKFDPTFENLSILYNNDKERSRFQILKTNARFNKKLSELFKISKYPSLKLLDYKTKRIYDYEDDRDLQNLIGYIDRKLNINPNYDNFNTKVKYADDIKAFEHEDDDANEQLVFFMAGYLPGWEDYKYPAHYIHQLALDYNTVEVIVVNVEELNDYELLSKFGVSQFPTVVYIKDERIKSYSTKENEMKLVKIKEFIENINNESTGSWKDIQFIDTKHHEIHHDNDYNDEEDDEIFEHIEL